MPRPGRIARLLAWARTLKQDGLVLWFALRHPGTPWWVKALAFVVVAYALSPIDLIPDFIPVLGLIDDALLLPGLIWLALRLLPAQVRLECETQARAWIEAKQLKPRLRAGVVLVVGVWVGLAALLGWALWSTWGQR